MNKQEYLNKLPEVIHYIENTDFEQIEPKIKYYDYVLLLSKLGSMLRDEAYDSAYNQLTAIVYGYHCQSDNRVAETLKKILMRDCDANGVSYE